MTYDNSLSVDDHGWQVFRVGQGVLLDQEGRVLLSANRWFSDKPLVWTLPGGRADEGEGVAAALVREFREETALEIEVLDLAFVAEARSVKRRQLYLTCAFTVCRLSGDLNCEADPGVEELRFVSPPDLSHYLPTPSLGQPLRHYLAHPHDRPRYWFFPEYALEWPEA